DYSGAFGFLSRRLFRAQTGSEAAKKRRWYAESVLAAKLATGKVTRNTLLNYPVAALADSDSSRTDILHEYFVPPERFGDFIVACRETIATGSKEDLLNVTLRWLEPDDVSVMAFAPGPRIAAVMLFPQSMTTAGEEGMRAMTERLID